MRISLISLAGLLAIGSIALADDFAPDTVKPDPKMGFDLLINFPMADPVLKIEDLGKLWSVWEPDLRAEAEKATPEQRHKLTFSRYGFVERDFDKTGLPLGYTDDHKGNLVTNCFSCHGGKVAGKPHPGLSNSHHDITTLITDVAKLRAHERGEDFTKIEDKKESFNTPFNMAKGVSNATMFAFTLGALRDRNLDITPHPLDPSAFLKHNDLIAPAWWHYKSKEKIYCDAFAPPTARQMMPFTMSPGISGEMIRSWEDEFQHIRAYVQSVQPPKYPFPIDAKLAAEGREHFEQSCAKCHGTYGENRNYPNKVVPIAVIGTDRVRYDALPPFAISGGNSSWFTEFGKVPVDPKKTGYIAQPLDGIWASAPYLHNGSVPTLEDMMNPTKRPTLWRRDEDGYDQKKVGVVYETFESIPEGLSTARRREYYDTNASSHGNGGHLFPDELEAGEKVAVIEYLKTL